MTRGGWSTVDECMWVRGLLSLWVEWVSEEACLGSVITDEGSKPDLLSTIAQTTAALTRLKPVWIDRNFLSAPRYDWCVPLSHLSSCMLVNLGPSRRAPKKNTSHGNEVLRISYQDHVTNEEVCAKIQQTIGPHEDLLTIVKRRKLQWYGHVSRSLVWPKLSCKAQWKGEEDEADWGKGGKTTSGNGQAWSSPSPRGQWRTGKNGENWLQNHLWCPNDPRG